MSILQNEFLNETLERFNEKKQMATSLNLPERYNEMQNPKKAERCQECGKFLAFDTYRNKESGEITRVLTSANFCKVKWCPMCAWRKARRIIAELFSVFSQIESNHRVAYVFLTLTTKNESLENLRALSAEISKAWHRLQQVKAWQKSILGHIRAIEYLGDETPIGECHLHYHSVLVVPTTYFKTENYIRQAQWVEMWQKVLRVDYKPIVDIRGIRPKSNTNSKTIKTLKNLPSNINPALIKALCECVKYIAKSTKVAQLNTDQFATLDQQARGLRQFNKGGLLKQYKPLPLDDEEIDPEVWEFLEKEFYKWCGITNNYKLDKN
ncbi:protein rep [Helicobacter suis]|uniref:protein rep n=1 Tax=Helicobacter suis TaxID=104628 RepID=UPI000CF176BF|nr:protein rep [Helicobacter suis]